MLLNRFEKAMMNNPVRALVQRHYEAQKLARLGGRVRGLHVLEVGCGRGFGVELLLDRFGAARVDAFDLDSHMVELAERRLRRHGDRVRLWQGSVTSIAARDGQYPAIFDFGIIHHVPAWRDALREIYRVLEPGGRFFAEEVLEQFILHPLWRRLLDHPQEDRFDRNGFVKALKDVGFVRVRSDELWGDFAFFAAEKA
jgi:ubiquinone/menaquinone biosynthesis C-methylase UbiE